MVNPAMMPAIAAALGRRQMQQQQPPQQQPRKPAYYGSIPEIAKAREADRRQMLADAMMQSGASTAPVAQGGWAWADGIARALSGGLGGIQNRKLDKEYGQRETDRGNDLAAAAARASTPQAAPTAPQAPEAQIAAALAPPQQAQAQPPAQPPAPPPASGPSVAPSAYQGGPVPMSAQRPQNAPFQPAPAGPGRGADVQGAMPSASQMFMSGIVSQEGVQNKDGTWQTSFKGAVGPAQVMPATARETARKLGIRFDENRYKNDPEYNLMLGEAYFNEQLETFGDPLKAAAAYNAGPGAVRRAVRRANRSGGEWVDYLPSTTKNGRVVDTTREYVERFAQRVQGGDASVRTREGGTFNEDVAAVGPTQVAPPQYEGIPQADRSNFVPDEVQTNRIAIAQALLESGNPDLAMMGQAYLDAGLTEQNAARMQRNTQQFTMGRDNRAFGEQREQAAIDRNFDRERDFNQNTFLAGENAATRQQQANIASADQTFRSREAQIERDWQDRRTAEQREFDRELLEAEAKAKQQSWYEKDPLWNTASGEKIRKDMRVQNSQLADVLTKVDTFLALNKETATGGIRAYTAGVEGAFGNENLATMDQLRNQIVLDLLGGLGVAISDGDRNFVRDSTLTTGVPYEANVRNAEIIRGLANRQMAYNREFLNWRAQNGPRGEAEFTELWDLYKEAVPIVSMEGETATYNKDAPSFREWLNNVPFEGGS